MTYARLALERLQSLWATRTEKERRVVMVVALVFMPIFFYSVVWIPLALHVAHWERVLPKERLALIAMRHEAIEIRSLRRHMGQAPTGTALLSFIEQSAQTAAIASSLSQLSPRGSHKAEAVFSKVPFNALVRFLAGLGAHGISAARVELTPAGVGLVSGSVTLAASA